MSYMEYQESKQISANGGADFYPLLFSAMRVADSENMAKIKELWPERVAEMQQRYDAPFNGMLPSDHMKSPICIDGQHNVCATLDALKACACDCHV